MLTVTTRTRFVLVLIVFALGGGISLVVSEQRDAIVGSQAQTAAAGDLLAAMLDQETGVHDFDQTSSPEFLEPFRSGRARFVAAVASAERRAEGDDTMIEQLRAQSVAADRWHVLGEEAIRDVRLRGAEVALDRRRARAQVRDGRVPPGERGVPRACPRPRGGAARAHAARGPGPRDRDRRPRARRRAVAARARLAARGATARHRARVRRDAPDGGGRGGGPGPAQAARGAVVRGHGRRGPQPQRERQRAHGVHRPRRASPAWRTRWRAPDRATASRCAGARPTSAARPTSRCSRAASAATCPAPPAARRRWSAAR